MSRAWFEGKRIGSIIIESHKEWILPVRLYILQDNKYLETELSGKDIVALIKVLCNENLLNSLKRSLQYFESQLESANEQINEYRKRLEDADIDFLRKKYEETLTNLNEKVKILKKYIEEVKTWIDVIKKIMELEVTFSV